jgi:hypothetical protein
LRPLKVHDVTVATQVLDLGNDTTAYEVMAEPPLLLGALQRTVMTPFLSVAVTRRGAEATVVGAIVDEFATKS